MTRLTCTKRRNVWRDVCPTCDSDNTETTVCGPDLQVQCLDPKCRAVSYKDRS